MGEKATCMITGDDVFAMLVVGKFFKTFTRKSILDTSANAEMILALSVELREEVDETDETIAKKKPRKRGSF